MTEENQTPSPESNTPEGGIQAEVEQTTPVKKTATRARRASSTTQAAEATETETTTEAPTKTTTKSPSATEEASAEENTAAPKTTTRRTSTRKTATATADDKTASGTADSAESAQASTTAAEKATGTVNEDTATAPAKKATNTRTTKARAKKTETDEAAKPSETSASESTTSADSTTETDKDAEASATKPQRRTRKTAVAEPKKSADHVSLDDEKSSKSAAMDAVAELVAQTPQRSTSASKKKEALEELEQVVDEELSQDGAEQNRRGKSRNQKNNRGRSKTDQDSNDTDEQDDSNDSRGSNSRNRQRDRKRRGNQDDVDPEILEDDVLIPIAGILDVLDNYAFVRTTGYLSGSSDIYVSLGQVKKYQLRKGDAVIGAIRQPREGENTGRQKYNALVKIDTVNGIAPETNQTRNDFSDSEPIAPVERLRLETDKTTVSTRMVDLLSPIGKGQRGLIIGPAASGKTTLVKELAQGITVNHPEVHLMVALLDARPEEVTDFKRNVKGEIIANDMAGSIEDQVSLAELAVERAKRLVELGHDVVILVDSLSRLAKAQYSVNAAQNRGSNPGFDSSNIVGVKRLFAAAQKNEQAGSLTIIGTVQESDVDALDAHILEELQQLANATIYVDELTMRFEGRLSVDPFLSGTRNITQFISQDEATVLQKLARVARLNPTNASDVITAMIQETGNNVELLMNIQRAEEQELVSRFES